MRHCGGGEGRKVTILRQLGSLGGEINEFQFKMSTPLVTVLLYPCIASTPPPPPLHRHLNIGRTFWMNIILIKFEFDLFPRGHHKLVRQLSLSLSSWFICDTLIGLWTGWLRFPFSALAHHPLCWPCRRRGAIVLCSRVAAFVVVNYNSIFGRKWSSAI